MGNLALDMKLGDTRPVFQATVMDGLEIVSLATATAVRLLLTHPVTQALINKTMTIEDAPNGLIKYSWATGDLPVVGDYPYEVEVDFADGSTQTFPAKGYGIISVHEDLD